MLRNAASRVARRFLLPPHYPFLTRSFSQEGEDVVLSRLLDDNTGRAGFYVDIGAHHPFRFSNTYRFYLAGWRGINVDAMPGSMKVFNQHRPRDINIEAAISLRPQVLTYYSFNEPAVNGFDPQLSKSRDGKSNIRIIATKEIQTTTLAALLSEHVPVGQKIDFMSVDVEGLDLDVLQSNDWQRFRPRYVLAEEASADTIADAQKCAITQYMQSLGYELRSKLGLTMIYRASGEASP